MHRFYIFRAMHSETMKEWDAHVRCVKTSARKMGEKGAAMALSLEMEKIKYSES